MACGKLSQPGPQDQPQRVGAQACLQVSSYTAVRGLMQLSFLKFYFPWKMVMNDGCPGHPAHSRIFYQRSNVGATGMCFSHRVLGAHLALPCTSAVAWACLLFCKVISTWQGCSQGKTRLFPLPPAPTCDKWMGFSAF